ncbi:hypothetical protein GGG16DRAFT_114955 [Schizophyllum commune]
MSSPPPGSPSPVLPPLVSPPPVLSLYRSPNRIWSHEFHFGPPTDETEDITFYMPVQSRLRKPSLQIAFAECVEESERVPITFASDIWALGSAIFETITGTTLFRNISPNILPERAAQMAGRVPPQWQAWWDSKPREPLSGDPDAWWDSPEQRDWIVNGCADERDADAGEEDTNGAIRLLKKLLTLDPSSRPCCEEILRDPWFEDVAT